MLAVVVITAAQLAAGKEEAYGVLEAGNTDAVATGVKLKEEKFQVTLAPEGPGEVGLGAINTVPENPVVTAEYWNTGCENEKIAIIVKSNVNVFFIA